MANAVTTKKAAPARKEPGLVPKTVQYLRESWAESRRATWPSWHDVQRLTSAVFMGVAVVTLYIYVLDVALASFTRIFFTPVK